MTKTHHSAPVKRASRNKKVYWRKGVDIKEVELHSQTVQANERLGLSTKSDAELFFIQKDPSSENADVKVVKSYQLRCYQNLKSDSAVPAFKQLNIGAKKTVKKEEARLERFARRSKNPKLKESSKNEGIYDLWNTKPEDNLTTELKSLPEDLKLNFLRSTGTIRPKVPASLKQHSSTLPAVEMAQPGQSYNPTFYDHQQVLKQATNQEMAKEKSIAKLSRRLATKESFATDASKFAEQCEGLNILKNKGENPEEDIKPDLDELEKLMTIPARPKPKTKKQRRRQHVHKLKEKFRLKEKENKSKLSDLNRVGSLLKEIKKTTKLAKENAERRKMEKEQKLKTTAQKLGKTKYIEPELEVQLSSEISGSLRKLKCEGSLLGDRYKSLQRRNIVESRTLQLKRHSRKFALKKYPKQNSQVSAEYVPR